MKSEQLEKLIIEILGEIKNIPNYNKPHGAILTYCMPSDGSILSRLTEDSYVLIQHLTGDWSVRKKSQIGPDEKNYIKKIFYSASLNGDPYSRNDLTEALKYGHVYGMHISCLEKICKASENILLKIILESNPSYNTNLF